LRNPGILPINWWISLAHPHITTGSDRSDSSRLIRLLTGHETGRERQRGHARVLCQGLAVGAAFLAARLPETAVVLGEVVIFGGKWRWKK